MNPRNTFSILLIILIFLTQNSFTQNALFQGLGDFPDGSFNSSAQGVSDNGSVVIGYGTTASGEQAFYWTEASGMVSLGNLPDESLKKSWANSVSADGRVIVGYGDPVGSGWNTYKGFIWTISDGMREIGSLDSSTRFMAFSVNADGSTVVGDGGPEAFRWEQGSGIEGLGVLPNRTHSRAIGISDDASVIIGQSYSLPAWNDEDGFIWTRKGGMQAMSSLTGGKYCMLLIVSPDGSVTAGTTNSSSTYPAFFRTESKGMVTIGHLPGRNTTHPTDMTPFGRTIVGGSFSGPTSGEAFIWDSTNGMRSLKTVLQTKYGLDLTGWTLQNASGITPNGNVIVGYGINPEGNKEAFRVILDTLHGNTQTDSIDYFGQTPPGDTPEIFAPGIITGYIHGKVAISPKGDEIYWVTNPSTERIMYSKLENGIWTNPALVDFVKDYLTIHNGGPVFSIDGEKLFFYSNRSGGIGGFDSWYVERTDSGWSKPINAGKPYNSINDDPSPLLTKHDKAFRLGLTDNNESLCFKYSDDKFSDPKPVDILPEYSPWWTIYISQEEDYLIFAGGIDNPDLFIRFKNEEGKWGNPVNMGNKINTNAWERFPFVSPDGKYLFFNRSVSDTEVIFWVSTHIIDSIKATLTDTKKEDILINKSFKLYQNYPNPFNPNTVISYQLPVPSDVKLKIYDILGQEVKTLIDKFQSSGEYTITWNATDNTNNPVSSGVYIYSLAINGNNSEKKMLLLQ